MFIDWASQLNLLEHDPNTHILKDFSLPVQKVLVQQVVTFLIEGMNSKTLTSAAHVCWAMEVCGQGFLLPMEEQDSISKAVTLYRIWALENNHRPGPINENPQFFLQKILKQSSLLFNYGQSRAGGTERHAQLCSEVLDIYVQVGRKLGDTLTKETWEIFLKILIAVGDSILRSDIPAHVESIQRYLCAQLHKVIFELWLLSGTQNPELWAALKDRVAGWTQHMPLILTWKVICLGLTKRVSTLLYGDRAALPTVTLQFDDSVQELTLQDEYTYYAWQRFLNLIGNPNETINDPPILLAFMGSVENLINQFLKVGFSIARRGTDDQANLIAPTGNTILHIFGVWLFDCVLLNRLGFDEGTAQAIKILSNIMITKHKTEFLPQYVASYYSCLQRALATEGRVLVSAITSSTALFLKEIKGIRCLVPLFFSAIQKVLSGRIKSVENVMPAEHFRKACLQIFSTIISLPNHLSATRFTTKALPGLEVSDYASLKPHFSTLLTESLTKETNLSNIEYLLNLSYIWVTENIDDNCDFVRHIIGLILRKVTQNRWTPDVVVPAFKILRALAVFFPRIEKGEEQANLVVDQLCRVILNINNPPAAGMETICVLALECISSWIMVDQWLAHFKDTRHTLLTAIVNSLVGSNASEAVDANPSLPVAPSSSNQTSKKDKKDKKKKLTETAQRTNTPSPKSSEKHAPPPELSEAIKEAADRTLMTLLNQMGNFPTPSGASSVSTLLKEDDILREIVAHADGVDDDSCKEYMRYYITDDLLILCLIDRPYCPTGPCVSIVVRDRMGRHAWDTKLSYTTLQSPELQPHQHDRPVAITTSPYQPTTVKPLDVNDVASVLGYLNNSDTREIYKTVEQQVQNEFKVLKRNDFRLNSDISVAIPAPINPYTADCKFQQARIFLSHVGYLSLENRTKLWPLRMDSNFYQALRQLDAKSERVCITVGVLYAQKGQTEVDEWIGNQGGSRDYQEFVATLGWGVSLADHNGFKGMLENGKTQMAPYWSDYSTEIVFQVPTLTPNDPQDAEQSVKREQAFECSTLILWLEDFSNFNAQSVWKHARGELYIITITPLHFGLYSVRLFTKNDLYGIGPVTDGCVLSKKVMGQLVRDTCMFIWHTENKDTPSPTQNRLASIERIFDSFKMTCSLEQFYTSQFTVLENGQLSPLKIAGPSPSSGGGGARTRAPSSFQPVRSPQKSSASLGSPRGSPQANIKNRAPAPSASSVEVGARKAAANLPVPATAAPAPPSRVQSQAPGSPSRPPPAQRPPPAARPPPSRPPPRGGRGRGRGLGAAPGGFAPGARPESPQREASGGWLGSRNPQAAASSPARRQPSFGTQRRQPNEEQ